MKLRECMELNKKIKEKSKELNAKKSISKKKRKEKAFNEAVYTKADDRGAEVNYFYGFKYVNTCPEPRSWEVQDFKD